MGMSWGNWDLETRLMVERSVRADEGSGRWLITAAGHLGRSVWRSGQESVSCQVTRLGAEAGFKSWVGRGRLSLNDRKGKKENTKALHYSHSETALNRGGELQLSILC